MKENLLLDRLQLIFRDIVDPEIILTEDLDATMVPKWDSLNHISIVVGIESEFDIEISVDELSTLNNVGDFVRLIERKYRLKS